MNGQLASAWFQVRCLGDEARNAAARLKVRLQPNSPAWHTARERDLRVAIHAINYHSHRRPA